MKIFLEHISDSPTPHTFRVTFHSATQRCLLPYPSVIGLTFADDHGKQAANWVTSILTIEPLDDFVLNPGTRIAFDLIAGINAAREKHRWRIDLASGTYDVHFTYEVDRDRDWYDFLAKRSRFAAITPIWRGSIRSNAIPFRVAE